jgi:hypothetical protein
MWGRSVITPSDAEEVRQESKSDVDNEKEATTPQSQTYPGVMEEEHTPITPLRNGWPPLHPPKPSVKWRTGQLHTHTQAKWNVTITPSLNLMSLLATLMGSAHSWCPSECPLATLMGLCMLPTPSDTIGSPKPGFSRGHPS